VGVDESDMNLGKMMCLSVSCFICAAGWHWRVKRG
jgi:hypothetical protein